jgi:hypothetical protein
MFVMSKTLSDGQTSRIYRKLVYESGLALTAFGSSSFLEQPGIFSAVALVNPGKSPDEVEKALIAEFDKLKTAGITERELQRAKNQFARDYVVSRLSIKRRRRSWVMPKSFRKTWRRPTGIRHVPEGVARRCEARGPEVFRAGRRMVMRIMPRGGVVEK